MRSASCNASADTAFTVQVSHNDGLKIWINDQLVYEKSGARTVSITPRERDIVLESSFPVQLKKETTISW